VEIYEDPYRDWPYAAAYLLETLDPDLIESHARQILSRALNIGRVVAFVGAGVAMSYGRISWKELVDTELKRVRAHLKAFLHDFAKKLNTENEEEVLAKAQFSHIRRLNNVLTTLELGDVRSDRYPMIFQLCEQLDNAIFSINWTPERPPVDLRKHAMELTVDDSGHAKQILIDALLDTWNPLTFTPRDRVDEVLGRGDDETAHRLFYRRTRAKRLHSLARGFSPSERIKAFHEAALDTIKRNPPLRSGRSDYLLPTERYVIGVLLRLLPDNERKENGWWRGIHRRVLRWEQVNLKDRAADLPVGVAAERRHGLVPQDRDPLLQLQERLEISRFLTTNYDLEIERLFKDQGYRHALEEADSSSNFLTPSVQDLDFDNDHAGALIAFAARDRSRNSMVVHLHGRAKDDSEIIVTERDYQRRYLRTDDTRYLVDDAISLTFGANPMLFVGSNMGEDDILRPLRQFMSGPSRVGDRIAVALIPALDDRRKRVEEKITHLGRYGVYTIHFGRAGIARAQSSMTAQEIDRQEVEWLPWVWQLKLALEACLRGAEFFPSSNGPILWPEKFGLKDVDRLMDTNPEPTADTDPQLERNQFRTERKEIVPPTTLEGIIVERERAIDLDGEVKMLNAALAWLRHVMANLIAPDHRDEVRREARALTAALQGAGNAILAVFTSAKLIRIRWDWDDWKTRWYKLPDERQAAHACTRRQLRPSSLLANDAVSIHRNVVRLLSEPEKQPKEGRFYAGAPSQTFFGLTGALSTTDADHFRNATGRRILLLCARRGLGKGHFFSALDDCSAGDEIGQRLKEFLTHIAPRKKDNSEESDVMTPRWVGLAFYNLSFTHEVMSIFDHMAELLHDRLPKRSVDVSARFHSLRHDRIELLRAMLAAWAELPQQMEPLRLLIAINGIGILFDDNGRPKNGQIKNIFDIFFSDEFASAPIDFVFVCQDEFIPRAFRQDYAPKSWKVILLERKGIDAKSAAWNRRRWEALDMTGGEADAGAQISSIEDVVWQRPDEPKVPEPWHTIRLGKLQRPSERTHLRTPAVAIHILHEARATIVAASYFPRIALLIARQCLQENAVTRELLKSLDTNPGYFPHVFEQNAVEFRKKMREVLETIHPDAGIPPKRMIPAVTVLLSMLLEIGSITSEESRLEDELTALRKVFENVAGDALTRSDPNRSITRAALDAFLKRSDQRRVDAAMAAIAEPKILEKSLRQVIEAYDHRMRDLHNAVGGGRYLLTLLLAGAYEITTELSVENPTAIGVVKIAKIDAVTYSVHRFLDRAVLGLLGVPTNRRSDVVIQQVLSLIHRHHERGEKLPVAIKLDWNGSEFENATVGTPAIHHLLVELIWHLSILGQGTEPDVLAWCPRIRDACDALAPTHALTQDEYVECVKEAIALGVNRCLIFQLSPESAEGAEANEENLAPRYAVHRLIQADVFQKLGAPNAEFTDTEQFTLSLYASQPDELPRLTREAHSQIAMTIAALSGYPEMELRAKERGAERGARAELHQAQSRGYRRRLLRAAVAIMRSIYSVAVLARLDHAPQGDEGTPGREGYFEEYRRIVRWILNSALDLTSGKAPPAPPFYSEELVWLYNECAVLSLVQGRLSDAQALFDAALSAAKRIEPDETGALHIRLLLNKALVDVERGRGSAARVYLEKIAQNVNEHPVPPLLAKGYLALIDHLAGEVGLAIAGYKDAIRGLVALKRSRAASIFSRHLGDLLSNNLGTERSQDALQELHNSVHFAQEGGHEDVLHASMLSLARCRMRLPGTSMTSIHNELDTIERYARVVGMPRLSCEVGLVRARLLLMQGETRLASSLAMKSLQIATVNDLKVRKVSSLLMLAEVHLQRKETSVVRPLLALGARMAKVCNLFFALTHAQKIEHWMDPAHKN